MAVRVEAGTRREPRTGQLAATLNWVRSLCPYDLSLCQPEWQTIHRPHNSNADLLALLRS